MIARNRHMGKRTTALRTVEAGRGHSIDPVEMCTQLHSEYTEAPTSRMSHKSQVFGWIHLAIALLLILPALNAFAQYEDGSLNGAIHDSTGAVVPNAAVTVTNVDTGIVTKIVSSGSGDYEVPSLRIGVYNIEASASGFAPAEAKNITVSVGGRQHIDLTLKVGQASATTVEVSDVALQIETESSQRGQTISNYQTEALPLVSRNFSDLLALVTGSRQAPTAATTSSIKPGARGRVQRQRPAQHVQQLSARRHGQQRLWREQPGFRQPDHRHRAGFGSAVQRGHQQRERGIRPLVGRNYQRGLGQRNESIPRSALRIPAQHRLNAAGFFKPLLVSSTGASVPFQKPAFNRNQFGFDFGGPILKDKLFFFLDYEGFRQELSPLYVLTLPTQNEINGNLVVPVTNPITGVTYPAGKPIPSAAINPLSAQILSYYQPFSTNCRSRASATTGLNSDDYAKKFLSPITPTKATCDWITSRIRTVFMVPAHQ